MSAPAEQPRPETAPKLPLREIPSWSVTIADVEQMAVVVGGKAMLIDADFQNVPCLDHPLGIRVQFGEEKELIRYNRDPHTRISIDPPINLRLKAGDIILEDGVVKIFDDAVVIRQFGQRIVGGEREDFVDEVTITRENYGFKREFNPS